MTSKIINCEGQRFGRLLVIQRAESIRTPCGTVKARWLCECDCGNRVTVRAGNLHGGKTQSCGCLMLDVSRANRIKEARHKHTIDGKATPTYRTWRAMVGRCTNSNHKDYPRYGAVGICVCERWLTFDNFLEDMGIRPLGTTIDRKNNAEGYYLENCRWATPKEQSRNQTSTKLTLSKAQAILNDSRSTAIIANHYGVSRSTILKIKSKELWNE